MVVDSVKWYENWDNSLRQLRKMWSAGYYSQTNLHTIILLDCSSSMRIDDAYTFAKKVGYNGVTTENINYINVNSDTDRDSYCVKSCDRFKICDNIFNNMGSSDAAAVITFSNQIEYSTGLTYDIDVLKEAMDYINGDGGTAYLNSALNYARSLIDGNSSDLYRIVVITNDDVTFDVISSDDFSSNTTLNIVNLGSNAIGYGIEGVAQATGGDVYNAVSAGELTCQSGGYIYTPPQYIGTDSDGDSIPDLVELYGLLPNGESLGTSPYETDSDKDGIPDNEEFNYVHSFLTSDVTLSQYTSAIKANSSPAEVDTDGDGLMDNEEMSVIQGSVVYTSSPINKDTDGDEIFDKYDVEPLNSNPSYNREASCAYADKWSGNVDTIGALFNTAQYPNLSEIGDCANFVSQCLYAGGYKMNTEWYMGKAANMLSHIMGAVRPTGNWEYGWTSNWTVAFDQYEYFNSENYAMYSIVIKENESIGEAIEGYDVRPGDLLYFCNDGEDPTHATIITDVEKNDIRFCGHSSARNHYKLSEARKGYTQVIIVCLVGDIS